MPDYTIPKSFLSVVCIALFYTAVMCGNIIYKLLIATFALGINMRIEYFILFLMSTIFVLDFNRIYQGYGTFILCALMQKSVFFFTSYLIKKVRNNSAEEIKLDSKEFITILAFALSNIFLIIALFKIEYTSGRDSFINIVISFFVILINIVILYFFDKLEKERKTREENIILQQRIDSEMQSIALFKQMYDEQRKNAHDFKNHLLTIKELANNPRELSRYMDSLLADSESGSYTVSTNNRIVDAVLNQKLMRAYQQDISVKFEISDLSKLFIENKDIVIILANAFDNAIEACEKMEDRYIKIRIIDSDYSTLISFVNSSPYVEIKNDGAIPSTKPDNKHHGYGLKNIKAVTEKYGGIILTDYRDKQFQLTISIDK